MASTLPYLWVRLVGHDALLLGSPLDVRLVSLTSGRTINLLTFESEEEAFRVCALTSLSDSASPQFLLAFVNDEKELSIFRLTGGVQEGSAELTQIMRQTVPKRVVKLIWEEESETEKRLIVGDRHGDVRSIVVSMGLQGIAQEPLEERRAKKARMEGNGKPDEGDEDDEEVGTLHVGHVSFLTDFVLSSFTTPAASSSPSSFIITSDRDEHIRISRWGPRRAGYIALRYLLGSDEAIGSLCTVEGDLWHQLQTSKRLSEHGKDVCKHPLLISCDGSTLRLWSLHPDAERANRRDCQASLNIKEAVQRYCIVDAKKERRRDRFYGKGKAKVKRDEQGAPILDDGEGHVGAFVPVIVKLHTFTGQDGELYLAFILDGAKALFSISLPSLVSCEKAEDLVQHIRAVDARFPILDYALHAHDGHLDAWIVGDVREEIVVEAESRPPLSLVRWNGVLETFERIDDDSNVVLRQQASTLSIQADQDISSSLILYDALTLYPKQEFERTEVLEALSADGRIKGGLANYEIPGRPASRSNKQNSEWATRKREKAREAMKQRIEARLAEMGDK